MYLSSYLSTYLSLYLSIFCVSLFVHLCVSIWLFFSPALYLSTSMSADLWIYLSIYASNHKGLIQRRIYTRPYILLYQLHNDVSLRMLLTPRVASGPFAAIHRAYMFRVALGFNKGDVLIGGLSGHKLRYAFYIRTLQVFVLVFLLLPHVESALKFIWSTKLQIPRRLIWHPACFVSLHLVFHAESNFK
jgi:hypothetical protein